VFDDHAKIDGPCFLSGLPGVGTDHLAEHSEFSTEIEFYPYQKRLSTVQAGIQEREILPSGRKKLIGSRFQVRLLALNDPGRERAPGKDNRQQRRQQP
jgi:hypothetical protein